MTGQPPRTLPSGLLRWAMRGCRPGMARARLVALGAAMDALTPNEVLTIDEVHQRRRSFLTRWTRFYAGWVKGIDGLSRPPGTTRLLADA